MIFARPILSTLLSTAVLVLALGGGSPRPEIALGARAMIVERADRADADLAALQAELAPAIDAARVGAARVVAGAEPPGPALRDASASIAAAEGAAIDARESVLQLDRARIALSPDVAPLDPATEAGELGSIAAQLESTAEAAEQFAAMRRTAASVAETLDAALAALDAGDLDAAAALAAEARAAHDELVEWEVDLVTLPVWIETTDAMIGAVERIVAATERGDQAVASAAADDFAALVESGETADRALRIAMGEGGSAVTAAPLGRLASVLSGIQQLRAVIASVREAHAG